MKLADISSLQSRDWRFFGLLGFVVFAGIGLGVFWLSKTSEDMLREVARHSAKHWATHLKQDIDPASLFEGDTISPDVLALLDGATRYGDVFGYKIYDDHGVAVAASRRDQIGSLVEGPYFWDVVARGQIYVSTEIVELEENDRDDEPRRMAGDTMADHPGSGMDGMQAASVQPGGVQSAQHHDPGAATALQSPSRVTNYGKA